MKNTIVRIFLIVSFISLGQPDTRVYAENALVPQYISPDPDSNYNLAGTTIAIRYADLVDAATVSERIFSVYGSASGYHPGKAILATDHKTVIFKPDQTFSAGERVHVEIRTGIGSITGRTFPAQTFSFNIGKYIAPAAARSALQIAIDRDLPATNNTLPTQIIGPAKSQFVTVPSTFPVINVTVPAAQTGDGFIFASNFTFPNDRSYLLILDNSGAPVFYQKIPGTRMAFDFKELPNGTLAYWDQVVNGYVILDSAYQVIDAILPGNGYAAVDIHDLQMLPNGDYLFMIYDAQIVDMSTIVPGGNPNATVVGLVIQELDPEKNVVFQWSSWNHVPITDTNQDLAIEPIDYVHGNAVALDNDGNILCSARHLDEIIKIDHQTGDTVWTLGGKANQFTFSSDPGINDIPQFYYQHDIRRLPNGNITLFDNHNIADLQASRALEYTIDEVQKTATLVWEFRETPDTFSPFMGNVQRLANGNTFIGWGGNFPFSVTEVRPDLSKAFEMNFNGEFYSYRAFRYVWHGYPTWAPALTLDTTNNSFKLTFSWNGATEIASYKILGGNTNQPNVLLAFQPKTGFETSAALTIPQQGFCYYRVIPINLNGQETQNSNVVLNPACGTKTYFPLQ